ncbi:RagB/SusD family nutrient uptake outer membrane protein [Gabonibacter chumensis]|uniref:RagB/SusD family nutrient uptake outer membrane protein n=1 Tax=Gabonibacter chumensis TaxID=2972474 RepID=UPI0025748C71|nr:RagB/SusD family nutrient uptake outer membrane protein [Gabonibacter chumensis]MCR9012328.1 RagB/SusD family nutrient uptake outer membrane protein [Gabonibacter chumensis]
MKKRLYLLLFVMGSVGCNDFLEEASQDEIRPSTVNDLEQILLGEAYLDDYNIYNLTDVFTDNVECYGVSTENQKVNFEEKAWLYRWDDRMFSTSGRGNDPSFWQGPYYGIGVCNIVLDHLDRMYGDARLRESIRGEALVLRACYYFHLVNFFGFPYNYGDPKENLGVPLKLNSAVRDEKFVRNSVAEVYDQIEKDLLEGNRLLKANDFQRDYFRVGHLAAKALLSRVYLYMENWDKALTYADSVLQVKPDLLDLNRFGVPDIYTNTFVTVYGPTSSDEIIWAREYRKTNVVSVGESWNKYPFSLSQDFLEVLGSSAEECMDGTIRDLRGGYFVSWGDDIDNPLIPRYQHAMVKDMWWGKYQGIRTAEMYLNRAEAYARKYKKEGTARYMELALEDVNTLRRHRLNNAYDFKPIRLTDADLLIEFVLNERRRELSGEMNHRWFDLRRCGMPTLTHVFFMYSSDEKIEYKLTTRGYLLPIPEEAIRLNPKLEQNVRQ